MTSNQHYASLIEEALVELSSQGIKNLCPDLACSIKAMRSFLKGFFLKFFIDSFLHEN